jgi:hypothetical protein
LIPESSDADCAQHCRDELKARDDVFEQVRDAEKAYGNLEIRIKMSNTQLNDSPTARSLALFHYKRAHILATMAYKDPVWKHKDEEHSVDVVEFDPELTADDYYLGELEMRGPQPPFKITRMSA